MPCIFLSIYSLVFYTGLSLKAYEDACFNNSILPSIHKSLRRKISNI